MELFMKRLKKKIMKISKININNYTPFKVLIYIKTNIKDNVSI